MRRLIYCIIPALVIAVLTAVAPFYHSCRELYNDVLRVHILANSDSAADQSLKLAVRDRVVAECAAYYDGCADKEQARDITRAHLSDIERIARDEIAARGFDYPVTARVEEAYFNTRCYENFTMPAGRYEALRLSIGDAAGGNWWCVIYPSLCVGAASGGRMQEELNDGEYRVVTADRLDFRFRIVEWFESILNWFR